jgi:hypothetical protein
MPRGKSSATPPYTPPYAPPFEVTPARVRSDAEIEEAAHDERL